MCAYEHAGGCAYVCAGAHVSLCQNRALAARSGEWDSPGKDERGVAEKATRGVEAARPAVHIAGASGGVSPLYFFGRCGWSVLHGWDSEL